MVALGEYIAGWLWSVVEQKLCAPIEKVRFTRIELCGALVLANSLQGIAVFFFDIPEQVKNLSLALCGALFAFL
jgi:hypothetical protein